MAVKTKTQLKADNDSEITTNGSGDITGAVLNGFNEDIIDSFEDFIPTYTTAQINALVSPGTRMMVYDSDEALYKYYTGVRWVRMCCPKYKVYTALLTQSGTNAPVATVLENTLGGTVVWSYVTTGSYLGTLVNAFTANKTYVAIGNPVATNSAGFTTGQRSSADEVNIICLDSALSPVDGVMANQTSIEIRVYY